MSGEWLALDPTPTGAMRTTHHSPFAIRLFSGPQMISTTTTILARCEQALILLAIVATAAMMALTSADAIMRYQFNRPIVGAYEITEKYLMVAAIFLGFSYAYRGGAFIRVTFLVDKLPQPWRGLANMVAYLMSILCCVLFVIASGRQAIRAASDTTTLATVPILAGPAQIFVPLGFLALLILMALDIKRVWSGEALLFTQDQPDT